jgi:hypothetical protein
MTRRLLLGVWMTLVLGLVASVPGMAADGRWKQGDSGCYFDPDDEGPDQCTRGRWKIGAEGSCYFDGFDSGPDQCALTNPGDGTASTPGQ